LPLGWGNFSLLLFGIFGFFDTHGIYSIKKMRVMQAQKHLDFSLGKKSPAKETSIKKKTGTCPDFLFDFLW